MSLFGDFNSSVPIPFQRLRAVMLEQGGGIQEGVLGSGDLKVSQRGAGANLSADVAPGAAWAQIDTGSRNGIGHVFNDAVFNAGPFTAGNGTNPRIDQVILRWNDSSIPTGAGNVPTIEVLTGTATSGATLVNRLGAAALPNDCVRLADVLMPISAASVTTANIVDRRPWARGAYFRVMRTTGNVSTTSSTLAAPDPTVLAPRIEFSGAPVKLTLTVDWWSAAASKSIKFDFFQDAAAAGFPAVDTASTVISAQNRVCLVWEFTPTAGSHTYGPAFASVDNATQVTLGSTAGEPLIWSIDEIVRPNTANT